MRIITAIWTILYAFTTVSAAASRNLQSSTPRTQTPLNETFITHQIEDSNATDFFSDTRTPPRIKQLMKKNEFRPTVIENSHPGVAVPIDEETVDIRDEKKNFYKLENKPTTDSGLSTWILLSGQTISSTAKPFKNSIKPLNETKNVTMIANRIVKPVFKKRPTSTTLKPTTTTNISQKMTTMKVKIAPPKPSTTESVIKLTKVKASVLNNAITSKNSTLVTMATLEAKYEKENEEAVKVKTTTTTTETIIKPIDSAELKAELKDGDLDLTPSSTTANPKKSRRPTNKKKKDKNKKRRPTVEDKIDNQNKTKVATKDKPITTQIYNYLAREVMPTVGVGLVGLVVTAGLASYFLYPFGALRRSYEVDRKDKDNNMYYYENDYSGGVPEEEAIGKVIAGMPLANDDYIPQSYKNNPYNNNRYRFADSNHYSSAQATVEAVQLDPIKDYKTDNYLQDIYQSNEVPKSEPITYNKDLMSKNVEAGYIASDQQYVVGNIPKEVEEVTPAAVPEHGPRSLKLRRRRRGVIETNMVEKDHNPKFLLENIKRSKLSQLNAKLKTREER